jgi:hypothetical protein
MQCVGKKGSGFWARSNGPSRQGWGDCNDKSIDLYNTNPMSLAITVLPPLGEFKQQGLNGK